MKKSTFAAGIVLTGLAVWGLMNPLAYINSFSFIDRLLVGGTMEGVEGFVGLFVMLLVTMTHGALVFNFWLKVVRRVKEVLNK